MFIQNDLHNVVLEMLILISYILDHPRNEGGIEDKATCLAAKQPIVAAGTYVPSEGCMYLIIR